MINRVLLGKVLKRSGKQQACSQAFSFQKVKRSWAKKKGCVNFHNIYHSPTCINPESLPSPLDQVHCFQFDIISAAFPGSPGGPSAPRAPSEPSLPSLPVCPGIPGTPGTPGTPVLIWGSGIGADVGAFINKNSFWFKLIEISYSIAIFKSDI